MAHEIARLLLEQAGNFLERTEAVRTALSLGMPLREIEEYLDWLDAVRPGLRQRCQPPEVIDLEAARPGAAASPSAPLGATEDPSPGPPAPANPPASPSTPRTAPG